LRFLLYALLALLGIVLLFPMGAQPAVELATSERSLFSPGGEDGVLEKIFEIVPPRHRFLVDLGAGDGETGSCSRNLILGRGWRGLVMEPDAALGQALLARYSGDETVTALQGLVDPGDVEIVLEGNRVPHDLDLLIIGLEANDWYVWRSIHDFEPSVVLIQYNAAFVPPQKMVIDYHPFNRWDGSLYFGASIQSLADLGERTGYKLIYADSAGRNLFFVQQDSFHRFGVADNSPLALYRGSKSLPLILPGLVWDHVDVDGRPRKNAEQVVPAVRIPRTYVFDDL